MKIKQTLLGVVAGLALSGSAMAHTAAKDSNLLAQNDNIIAKTMEHINIPKAPNTDVFIANFVKAPKEINAKDSLVIPNKKLAQADTLAQTDTIANVDSITNYAAYQKSGTVLEVPKYSIKVLDADDGHDLTDSINAIDSTIIKDGGLDLEKVDSLEYEFKQKTKKNLPSDEYQKILADKQITMDSTQRKNIQAKLSDDLKRELLTTVAYTHANVMVKTRSLTKPKKDIYQQVEINHLGDINKIKVKGKVLVDSINPKIPEVHTKGENPLCGEIGYATTKQEVIFANTCDSNANQKPVIHNRVAADTMKTVVADTMKTKIAATADTAKTAPEVITTRRTLADDAIKTTPAPIKEQPKPIVKKMKSSVWNLAKTSLDKNATQKDILKLTKDILKLNGLTMESAKHLKTNALIKMPTYLNDKN